MSRLLKLTVLLQVLLFLLFTTSSLAFPRAQVRSNTNSGRIIGGRDAPEGFAPYQAGLLLQGYGFYGAAVLISGRFLVTAAHCLYGIPKERVEIFVGSNSLSVGGYRYEPELFIIHELFTIEEYYKYDIGLIKSAETIVFNDRVQPVELARTNPVPYTLMTVTGWGSNVQGPRENATIVDRLQLVYSPYITIEKCFEVFPENPNFFESQFCTQPVNNTGICSGDSGGPFVSQGKVYGVTSYSGTEPCSLGNPDYASSVVYFYDWLTEKIRENS